MLSITTRTVKVVEVGPRDGLQNEKTPINLEDKLNYIQMLINAGIRHIETTSFVHAQAIPQMADAKNLMDEILKKNSSPVTNFICLVPNLKGLERALDCQVKSIALFTATSETFNQKNIKSTIDESLQKIQAVVQEGRKLNLTMRGYISTAFGCPYEKKTSYEMLEKITCKFFEMGIQEVSWGDTIGVAMPLQVDEYLEKIKSKIPFSQLAMHFHDTKGMALANILTSLNQGVCIFDASSGGLGGCPYAKGATGNVATEDLLYLLNSFGIKTGIDLEKLSQASHFILSKVQKQTTSKFLSTYFDERKRR